MRTFIAFEIPDRFRHEAAALARLLGETMKGRFVEPGNYHVTLAFLGDTDEREAGLAMDALDAACAGLDAPPLACDGLGKFGNANDATLWLGLAQAEALMQVAATVRDELFARGIAFDQKPFKPHITLARRAAIPKTALPVLPFPEPARASAAALFKSELDPQGATYTLLHSVRFG